MGIVSGGGGGGNTTAQVVASGKVLPAAHTSSVTVDSTTYDDPFGSGKLTTLIFPSLEGALAFAVSGDAFPRMLLGSGGGVGLCMADGTTDVSNVELSTEHVTGGWQLLAPPAQNGNGTARLGQVSPVGSITAGALPTLVISSGTGRQIQAGVDSETVTPFLGDGTNNTATCKVELSPDNVTYSVLNTVSIAAALNLAGVLNIDINLRVPAGWYVKLTAVHGTLGTTTYY